MGVELYWREPSGEELNQSLSSRKLHEKPLFISPQNPNSYLITLTTPNLRNAFEEIPPDEKS